MTRVGEVSTYEIDLKENGYYYLGETSDFWEAATSTFKNIGFNGLLVGYLHYKKVQDLARLWEIDNDLRASMIEMYGKQFHASEFEKKSVVLYQWHWDARIKIMFSPSSQKSMWIYIGPELFGQNDAESVTSQDVKRFFEKIGEKNKWQVKLEFIGTAKTPFPPGWGYINLFRIKEIEGIPRA